MIRSIVMEKYLTKLDELISTGKEICNQNERREGFSKGFTRRRQDVPDEIHTVHPEYAKWKYLPITWSRLKTSLEKLKVVH